MEKTSLIVVNFCKEKTSLRVVNSSMENTSLRVALIFVRKRRV